MPETRSQVSFASTETPEPEHDKSEYTTLNVPIGTSIDRSKVPRGVTLVAQSLRLGVKGKKALSSPKVGTLFGDGRSAGVAKRSASKKRHTGSKPKRALKKKPAPTYW